MTKYLLTCAIACSFLSACATAPQEPEPESDRPRLFLNKEDVSQIESADQLPAAFAGALSETRQLVDPYIGGSPDIPTPVQAGGGYTHEQHKMNANIIQGAGALYLLGGNEAYVTLVRDMLLEYAEMYPGLGLHPAKKEQSPGKLFWQSLNEAVWLVAAIQGYDAVYETLSADDRNSIEENLFHPMVDFLSVQAPETFDKIHNHGTWAVAAVGMTGYVLDRPDYVEKALFGLKLDGNAGFMKQLDDLFSPDGYYGEGPYYQRYALMPFLLFADAIDRNDPERNIFDYRDQILLKAVDTTIQLSYAGYFFPLNDAIKDKGLDTVELCYGVAIAYGRTNDTGLLSIADYQQRIVLTGDGFRLARALQSGDSTPYNFRSVQLKDGPQGDQGTLDIIRNGGELGQTLVFKATAQGQGHGHFDKLNWLLYDQGHEIVPDYGAARFLNVESKYGGHYLPENNAWAKQTIAHNTLVVDETSHFDGELKTAEKFHPQPLVFDVSDSVDLVAARMQNAYDGVDFTRVMAVIKNGLFDIPATLDVVKVTSEQSHQYDLPLHFKGHITNVSHELNANTSNLPVLGEANGYQYLWLKASADVAKGEVFSLTFIKDKRFYTWSVLADDDLEILITELGANDPDFNLRKESAVIVRASNQGSFSFVSVFEPHGVYNGSREFVRSSATQLESLSRHASGTNDLISITNKNGESAVLALSYDPEPGASHQVSSAELEVEWQGFFALEDVEANGQ